MAIKPNTLRSANNTNSAQSSRGRYVGGGVTETNNGFLEWWERYSFAKDSSDTVYTVENANENRLDLIAAIFYGDTSLSWLLAQYNNIIDPMTEVTAGRLLLIPSKDRVSFMLGNRKGGIASTRQPVNTISPIIT